jgi:hypothetical protein
MTTTQVKLHFNGKKWLRCTDTTGRCPYGADAHKIVTGEPSLSSQADLEAALDSLTAVKVNPLKEALEEAKENFNIISTQYEADPYSVEYGDYVDARFQMRELETLYAQTPEGLEELKTALTVVETDEERSEIDFKIREAQNNIIRAKEKAEKDARFGGSLAPNSKDFYYIEPATHGGDPYWTETTGSKYDKKATVKDIAGDIRKDISTAVKAGYLPSHVQFKTKFNSSDQKITVTIVGADDEQVFKPEVDEIYKTRKYTEEASELLSRVEKIMKQYNFSRFDVLEHQTNMTNFWVRCNFESAWEKEERLAKEKAKV